MREVRVAFHQRLQAVEVKIIELFTLVTEDLAVVNEAVLNGDTGALQVASERDAIIDGLCRELEHTVEVELALQTPVTGDLRLLLSVLHVVPELERSHDLVVQLAEHATPILSHDLSGRCRGLVQQMGETAADMWTQAANAWYQRDRTTAGALAHRDVDLDRLHAALLAELASGEMSLPVTMDMTLVARFYRRLGDHAVNVAHRVVYLAGRPHAN